MHLQTISTALLYPWNKYCPTGTEDLSAPSHISIGYDIHFIVIQKDMVRIRRTSTAFSLAMFNLCAVAHWCDTRRATRIWGKVFYP